MKQEPIDILQFFQKNHIRSIETMRKVLEKLREDGTPYYYLDIEASPQFDISKIINVEKIDKNT